jgi:hypothetical protein
LSSSLFGGGSGDVIAASAAAAAAIAVGTVAAVLLLLLFRGGRGRGDLNIAGFGKTCKPTIRNRNRNASHLNNMYCGPHSVQAVAVLETSLLCDTGLEDGGGCLENTQPRAREPSTSSHAP